MIYTCTSNPSLDYYLTLDEDLKKGQVCRSSLERYECGGKGINVSIVLANLGIRSSCLGFLGGFTKDFYNSLLTVYPGVQPLFTSIKGNTRINIKLERAVETSINAKGPLILDEEFEKFKKRAMRIYENDIFVLSGNIQDEVKDKMVSLTEELSLEAVKVVLDCTEDVIDRCLCFKPFLANISHLVSEEDNEESIKQILLDANNKGVKNAIVHLRNKPSYFSGNGKVYKCESTLNENYVTGSFDSFVAGFLYTTIRGGNSLEAFTYGEAASLATSRYDSLADKEKTEECFKEINIIEI